MYYGRIHVTGRWRVEHGGEGLLCHSLGRLFEVGGNGRLNVHIVGYDGSVHCMQFVQSGSRYSRLRSIARVSGAATAPMAIAVWALSSSEGKESNMERDPDFHSPKKCTGSAREDMGEGAFSRALRSHDGVDLARWRRREGEREREREGGRERDREKEEEKKGRESRFTPSRAQLQVLECSGTSCIITNVNINYMG